MEAFLAVCSAEKKLRVWIVPDLWSRRDPRAIMKVKHMRASMDSCFGVCAKHRTADERKHHAYHSFVLLKLTLQD